MLEEKPEVGDVTKTKGRKFFKEDEMINCVTAESLSKMETELPFKFGNLEVIRGLNKRTFSGVIGKKDLIGSKRE